MKNMCNHIIHWNGRMRNQKNAPGEGGGIRGPAKDDADVFIA